MFSGPWFEVQPAALRKRKKETENEDARSNLAHKENRVREREITKMLEWVCVFAEAAAAGEPDVAVCILSSLTEREWWLLLIQHRIWHTLGSCLSTQHIPTGTQKAPKHASVHKQRLSCKALETKVPQSHLSWATCDVITNCSTSAHLLRGRSSEISQLKAAERENTFCPSVWEIHCRVFTSHNVLLTPHLQQSKCYPCTGLECMFVWRRAPERKSTVKQWKGPPSLCKQ